MAVKMAMNEFEPRGTSLCAGCGIVAQMMVVQEADKVWNNKPPVIVNPSLSDCFSISFDFLSTRSNDIYMCYLLELDFFGTAPPHHSFMRWRLVKLLKIGGGTVGWQQF